MARGAETLQEVLADWEQRGFAGQFGVAPEGAVRCFTCRSVWPAGRAEVAGSHRLEGASDPDDMLLVIALRCPVCGVAGTLVCSYGPEASLEEGEVLRDLQGVT